MMKIYTNLFYISTLILMLGVSMNVYSQNTKVVGGQNATNGDYSWMVSLARDNVSNIRYAHFCGGTLITSQWVLTAAHCVIEDNALPIDSVSSPSEVDVVINAYNLASPNIGYKRINVDNIIRHPFYSPLTKKYDIALLHIVTPSTQGTIKLPPQSDVTLSAAGKPCRAIGWGIMDTATLYLATILQQADIEVISNSTCNTLYGGAYVDGSQLCAGKSGHATGSAQGDSGGPLIVNDNGTWTQIGVVSYGHTYYTTSKYPGVFTKVSNYTNWINNTVGTSFGIEDTKNKHSSIISFYEDNKMNIQINNPEPFVKENFNLSIVDMYGRIIYTEDFTNTEYSNRIINLESYSNAPYILMIKSEKQLHTNKFIKN